MAARDSGYATKQDNNPRRPAQKETSITANVVRMGQVSMAFPELDIVRNLVERSLVDTANVGGLPELTQTEMTVAAEFIQAVDDLR